MEAAELEHEIRRVPGVVACSVRESQVAVLVKDKRTQADVEQVAGTEKRLQVTVAKPPPGPAQVVRAILAVVALLVIAAVILVGALVG